MRTTLRLFLLAVTMSLFLACEAINTQGFEAQENSDENGTKVHARLAFSEIAGLDDALIELSGMIAIEGRLFAHNDSGDDACLYELDVDDGKILRTIKIDKAWEADWEDIAQDETSVYIGDIGNNIGKRKDLRIYKIDKAALLSSLVVEAEMISFSYADQKTFGYDEHSTPYDAEALIAYGDSLYIFTKNWADYTTSVYPVPKLPGEYVVKKLPDGGKRLEVMVTGAAFDPESGKVALIGYSDPFHLSGLLESKLMVLSDFPDEYFFLGSMESYTLSSGVLLRQYEAVTFLSEGELFISGEGRRKILPSPSSLYQASISWL